MSLAPRSTCFGTAASKYEQVPKSISACDPGSIQLYHVPVVFERKHNLELITADWFVWMIFVAPATHQMHVFNHKSAFRLHLCLCMSSDPLLKRLALSSSWSRISLFKSKSCVFHMGLPDLLHALFSLFLPFISTLLFFISLSPQSQQKHHISDRQWGIMIILEGKKRMQRGRKVYAGCNPILGLLRECVATLCVCDCAKVIFPKTCHIQRNMGIWVNSVHFCLWFLTFLWGSALICPQIFFSFDETHWVTPDQTSRIKFWVHKIYIF